MSGAKCVPSGVNPCSSGAMKPRVPFKSVDLAVSSSRRLLIPKSPILTHHCCGGQDLIKIFCICSQIDASVRLMRLGDELQALGPDGQTNYHAYRKDPRGSGM